jgi:hypothetical protein
MKRQEGRSPQANFPPLRLFASAPSLNELTASNLLLSFATFPFSTS